MTTSPGSRCSILVLSRVEEEAAAVLHRVHLEAATCAEASSVVVKVPDDGALQNGGPTSIIPGVAKFLAHGQALHKVEKGLVGGTDVAH